MKRRNARHIEGDLSLSPVDRSLKIVAIGGGTGLATLLRGLRPYALPAPSLVDVTAVVTVTDDGGSSGRLRQDFDVLPPGDIRNCLVALSGDEPLLSRLFQYRFPAGQGLKGHSFGNLFLTALSNVTGDFAQAVRVSSEVLAIAGRIFPSTATNVSLEATLQNGARVAGETRISKSRARIQRVALIPRHAPPLRETLQAIAEADLITLGPGSLFTSVIPNLLVEGIPKAIRKSSAVKVHIVNLMSQPGETTGFSAADHVEAIHQHSCAGLLDCVVLNTRPITRFQGRKYAQLKARPVEIDLDRLKAMGLRIIEKDLLDQGATVRHEPASLARVVLDLAAESRGRRL
jgi:uncharacterized cofD-like protein